MNSLFLAGLAAAVIPVIVHLLQRRRLKRIEFSDLRFLVPLNQQRMRSMNLRRWLLLLLRVAIVSLVAIAMARPSIRGGLSALVPAQARSSVLLLLDTSYSMRAEGERGTSLDAARTAAYRVLDGLQQGDGVSLMTFNASPKRWFQTPIHDFSVVRERLRDLQPSYAGTNWTEAMEAALTELDKALEPNKELYVISDFSGVDPESISTDLIHLQKHTRIALVPVRVEPFVNVSIDKVSVPPSVVLREDPVRVSVSLRNHAQDVPADCVLRIDMDGEPKGESNLRLGRNAVQTRDFTLVAMQSREIEAMVTKRVDRLPVDDVRYFVLPVLSELNVLHLRNRDNSGGGFFLARALQPTKNGGSPIRTRESTPDRFSSNDLEGMRVVILSSDVTLSGSQAEILSAFVDQGGGLCVFSGKRETADSINRLLGRLGDTRVRGVVLRDKGFVNLSDLRPTGILDGFKPEELQSLERIQFTRYSELTSGPTSRTLLRFTGSSPAMIEGTYGSGKYVLFGFDAGKDASNLALSTMFLPLIHRTVVYLAGTTGRQTMQYDVGDRIDVRVPLSKVQQHVSLVSRDNRFAQAGQLDGGVVFSDTQMNSGGKDSRQFTVTTPSGKTNSIQVRYVGKMAFATFEETVEPGHYIFEGLGQKLVRAVNVNTQESNLLPFEPVALTRALNLRAEELRNATAIGQHIREARHGKEIYKLIVALVLLLMVVELMVSRAARRPMASGS